MVRFQQTLASLVVAAACGIGTAADAGQEPRAAASDDAATLQAAASGGRIAGAVTDAAGAPLGGVMVSAVGPSGAELALSETTGQFLLRALLPGVYLVQAHLPGFAASRRELIEVSAREPTVHAITLRRVGSEASPEPIAASFGLAGAAGLTQVDESTGAPAETEAEAEAGASAPHDHSEKAWRLRRVRRSVLKAAEHLVAGAPASAPVETGGRFVPRTASLRASATPYMPGLADLPVRGQVNLLTRGMNLLTGEAAPANIANVSVGAPVWNGDWSAQGAMTTGDVSSWVVSGAYLKDNQSAHRYGMTVTYGRQQYEGGNPAALMVPSESRYAASFGATDVWQVSPLLALEYGGRYSTYGYVEGDGLVSPRLGVTVSLTPDTRVVVVGSQENVAPGADEFIPPAQSGLWLPPERTFAAFAPAGGIHPERTRNLDVALEHDLTEHYVVGVRRFRQDVRDQFATIFGMDFLGLAMTGHYDIARAGSVSSDGWILSLRRQLGERVSGSIEYAVAEADWNQAAADMALGAESPGSLRAGRERFHDVSGVVNVEIPETATRVFARCRVNTAFARPDGDNPVGTDTRFEVRINQELPFSPFHGSRWEVLVAVRTLFFEPTASASLFDELLLARPPKQVVGGLVVHF